MFIDAISSNTDQPAAVGTVINVLRQTFGFIGPFWFTPMYENLGYAGATGLLAGLVFVLSGVPTMAIHLIQYRRDRALKQRQEDEPYNLNIGNDVL